MIEQTLSAGERRQTEGGDILALSPLPVYTGAEASDPVQWIRSKNDELMDLQGGNFVFAAELALMFLSLALLTLIVVGFVPSLIKWSDWGYFSWGMPAFIFVGHVFFTLPFGLVIHFRANKELKESPPVRLNRKKRQVAIPSWAGGKDLRLPFWGGEFFGFVYVVFVFTSFSVIGPFLLDGPIDERGWAFLRGGLIALAIESLIFVPYLVIGLHLKKKHASRLEYVFYPWEKLVAYIEERSSLCPMVYTEQVILTLAVPDPEDPETALAAASMSVGSDIAGIAQWESLRRFMEDGPEACPDPQNNDTLAHYKESCRRAREELSTGAWLWKKVGDWFFQRYLAYIITERRLKNLVPRSLPKDFHEWSKSIPEDQQVKPSKELQKANEKIRSLRRKRPHLTPQQLLEEYYKLSTEDEALLA